MSTLLLSDLHLPPERSPLRDTFVAFLEGPARKANAVYILGDLFEYWIGDRAGLRQYAREIAALSALTVRGVAVYFQQGNRDFLVGEDFALLTGARLLPDPAIAQIEGVPTLISHGDLFCTGDVGYQRWRRFSRNGLAQRVFLMLPLRLRAGIAGGLRGGSNTAKRGKQAAIMDVEDASVRAAFAQTGVTRMIHGHTHRPGQHDYELDGRRCERVVLADWRPERMEYLELEGRALRRVRLE